MSIFTDKKRGGIMSTRNTVINGDYKVAVQFKDGKRSLLDVDEKIYKTIIRQMF